MPVWVLSWDRRRVSFVGVSTDPSEIVKSYSLLSVNVAGLSRFVGFTGLTESLAATLRELPKIGNWSQPD